MMEPVVPQSSQPQTGNAVGGKSSTCVCSAGVRNLRRLRLSRTGRGRTFPCAQGVGRLGHAKPWPSTRAASQHCEREVGSIPEHPCRCACPACGVVLFQMEHPSR